MNSEQAVADLLWVVNSPSLVTGSNVAAASAISPDDIDGEHLAEFLDAQPGVHRVGRYFEQLVHYWLVHIRRVELVAHGLQLKDGKITVGELDFLYRNEAGALVHCEASVKFFLHAPGTEPSEYPGPNARDNFESKVTKLFGKQLAASEGRIDDITVREGFLRGVIFSPDGSEQADLPERLAPDHLRGRWTYAGKLVPLEAVGDTFAIMSKPHWLAPQVDAKSMDFGQLQNTLANHFSDSRRPLMISARTSGAESTRVIVVSHEWPQGPSA